MVYDEIDKIGRQEYKQRREGDDSLGTAFAQCPFDASHVPPHYECVDICCELLSLGDKEFLCGVCGEQEYIVVEEALNRSRAVILGFKPAADFESIVGALAP